MGEKTPLTGEQREAALRSLRGTDLEGVVQAAKLLSADSSTTAALLELLESERPAEVRQGILYALSWHGDVSLWGLFLKVLSDRGEHPTVRGQAAEGLAYLFSEVRTDSQEFEEAVGVLRDSLTDSSPEVRYCALFALGATKHLPLIPVLEEMLKDGTPVEGWAGTVGDEAARAIEWIQMANLRRGG